MADIIIGIDCKILEMKDPHKADTAKNILNYIEIPFTMENNDAIWNQLHMMNEYKTIVTKAFGDVRNDMIMLENQIAALKKNQERKWWQIWK